MDVEDVIERIGGFGRAQKKIVCLVNIAHLVAAFHALGYTFITEDPGWSCPPYQHETSKACAMVANGSCLPQYAADFTSIVTEWDLICKKKTLPKLSQSAFFLGFLLGAWFFGWLSDLIGRRKTFFISAAIISSSGLGYGLAFNYYFFVLMRISCAFGSSGFILSSYVLSVEVVGRENRKLAGLLGSGLFAVSYPLVALMAYLLRHWRVLTVLNSALGFSMFFLFNVVPESPRWLAVNGRMAEAKSVLADFARENGTEMPEGELQKPDKSSDSLRSLGTLSLLSGPVIRKRTLILFAAWVTNCLVYYSLAMRSADLGNNRYVSFAISGLVELPAYFLAYKLLNRVGRKWTHGTFLVCAGAACLLWSIFCVTGHVSLGPPVALLGKFAVAGSFGVIYLYSAELFPTQVRNIGMGVSSAGARLGGILAPVVLMTDEIHPAFPMLLMGVLAFLTGLLSLCLPETLNQPLPDTIQALEAQKDNSHVVNS